LSNGTTVLFGLAGVRGAACRSGCRWRAGRAGGDGSRDVGCEVSLVWGRVHFGEGVGDHEAAGYPLRDNDNLGALVQAAVTVPGFDV
jgi:hypothetical protein